MAYGKSIELFLANGTADSLIIAELSNWNGKAIKIPRIEVSNCNRDDFSQAGVYFLFCKEDDGSDSVYIGEAENIKERLAQHIRNYQSEKEKYYWNTAVVYQEITRKIRDKKAQREIRELFDTDKPEEMLEYIQIYATSVESPDEKDKSSQRALELYQYLEHNREGLLPYDKRGIKIAAPPEGILYKRMDVQENQNCTVITRRMKNRRMRWSVNGANNLAKLLYRKENKELIETIERCTAGLVFTMQMQEIVETLSAAKAPKKDGKGNPYVNVVNVHMPLLEAMQTASRKAFKRAFCC